MEYRQMIEDEREEAKQEGFDLGWKMGMDLERTHLIYQLAKSMSAEEIAQRLEMDIEDVQFAIVHERIVQRL